MVMVMVRRGYLPLMRLRIRSYEIVRKAMGIFSNSSHPLRPHFNDYNLKKPPSISISNRKYWLNLTLFFNLYFIAEGHCVLYDREAPFELRIQDPNSGPQEVGTLEAIRVKILNLVSSRNEYV